jgi:viroplasmin and RNaseH domain-containing protein
MKITILTKEESLAYLKEEQEIKCKYTTEQIIAEAEAMQMIPSMGNTQYVNGSEQWEAFYDWLTTGEAKAKWDKELNILSLARYFAWKYYHNMSDAEIEEIIDKQSKIKQILNNQ